MPKNLYGLEGLCLASLRHLEPEYVAEAFNMESSPMLGSAQLVHDLSATLHADLSQKIDVSESTEIVDRWRTEFTASLSGFISPEVLSNALAYAGSYADAVALEDHLMFHRAPLEEAYGVDGDHSDDVHALAQGARMLGRISSDTSIAGLLERTYDQINLHILKTETTVGVQRQLLATMPRELWLRYMLPPDRNLENFFDELSGNRIRLESILMGHSSPRVAASSHSLASYFSLVQTFAGRHQSRLADTEIWADAMTA